MSETLRTDGDRSTLRIERRFPHPQAKVWRAVTDPAHLDAWFPFRVELEDLVAGGVIRFVERDGGAAPTSGTVVAVDEPTVFAFTWEDSELRFELAADGDGCLLTFTHVFGDRYGAASFTAGWHTCLDAMDASLRGSRFEPADMSEAHDRFVEQFGLDEGVADGDVVRFERQLTRDAATAWPLVAELADGPVVAAEDGSWLEYDAPSGGGRVRLDLTKPGTGQGARFVVTVTGAPSPDDALAAWPPKLRSLGEHLRRVPA